MKASSVMIHIWDKVFKSRLSKFFKGCLPQNLLSSLLNTSSHLEPFQKPRSLMFDMFLNIPWLFISQAVVQKFSVKKVFIGLQL